MNPAHAAGPATIEHGFHDGFGHRIIHRDPASGEPLEILHLRPELTAVPSFEFALRERTARVANFRHAYYARVRRIDRVAEPAGSLAVVSQLVEGSRLSDILAGAERYRLPLDINAALCLVRQLVPAVAVLHENARDVAHGTLGPERLVITPHARLVILEHVLGSALEQLQLTRDRLWQEYRVAMPPSAGLPRFDQRADVAQIGLTALSLVLGRLLRADDYPARVPDLLAGAASVSAAGERQPLSSGLRLWLMRALQLDPRRPFTTAREAQVALEQMLAEEGAYVAAPVALEIFLETFRLAVAVPPVFAAGQPPDQPGAVAVTQSQAPADLEAGPAETDGTPASGRPAPSAPPPAVAAAGPQAPPAIEDPAPPDPGPEEAREELPAFLRPASTAPAPLGVPEPEAAPLFDSDRDFTSMLERSEEPDERDPYQTEPDEASPSPRSRRRGLYSGVALLGFVAVILVALIASRFSVQPGVAGPESASLSIDSAPTGAEVYVNGLPQGVTPLTLSLPAGPHIVELRGRGTPRVLPLTLAAGAQVAQYIELPDIQPLTGQLQIRTEPAGARVTIAGALQGTTPLTIDDLAPGEHTILLEGNGARVEQRVTIDPGATAALVVPLVAAGPASGWLAISAPVDFEIYEQGRLIGSTQSERIMLPAGRHEIELVNTALAYRATRVIQVPAGRVATVRVELPRGVLHLNATPWAEVWIDGEHVGETPIGNLSVPIGPHEIVFRHPQLGEQRHAATVTLAGPTRVSVDLRK